MKKINSNAYAGKVIATGMAFLLVGVVLRGSVLGWISMIIGGAVVLGFFVWLWIELRQDRDIQRRYERTLRHTKCALPSGRYECQACGFQGVGEDDAYCKACHTVFTP